MKRAGAEILGLLLTTLLLAAVAVLAYRGQPVAIHWPEPSLTRLQAAATTVLVYGAGCALLLWRRRSPPAAPVTAGGLLLVHASQTGHAEQVARQSVEALRAAGVATELLALGALDAKRLREPQRLLFVVSTTGEGDAPDSAFGFVAGPLRQPLDLSALRYGVLALGDRRYRHYCGFGHALDQWLRQQGAQPLFDTIEVDNGDAAALQRWREQLGTLTGTALGQGLAEAEWPRWRLVARQVLNPGSVGAPLHQILFEPVAGLPPWQAGDIAEIRLPPRDAAEAEAQRDYSIASLPAEGRIELLVRELRDAAGQLGRGSGWLCVQAAIGSELPLRIRSNAGFHLPEKDRPLILVGNGTGLAGLRALIKARAAAGQHRNWLLYGERNAARDHIHGDELKAWQQAGVLARVDYAWSRDQPERLYVQQRLREAAATLRLWVAAGAAIYVCGGAQDMAPAVEQVLLDELGADTLHSLREAGRYRRDVY